MDSEMKIRIDEIIQDYCSRVANPELNEYGLFATNEAETPSAALREALCVFSWYKMCLHIIKLSKTKGLDAKAQVEVAKR
jgi:hypothetical protein